MIDRQIIYILSSNVRQKREKPPVTGTAELLASIFLCKNCSFSLFSFNKGKKSNADIAVASLFCNKTLSLLNAD